MYIYIIIALIVGILTSVELSGLTGKEANQKIHKLLFALFTIFAIIFVGFRECGFDYDSYMNLFEDFMMPGWKENAQINNIELGYAFINYLLGDYYLVLVVMAFVTITLQFVFIYKYSPYPFLTLFLMLGVMLYPSLMGQYRQALAIAIVLWAFVDRKNKLKFLSLILIASMFHATSLIGLLVYFIPDKFFKTKYYFILLGIGLFLNFILEPFVLSIAPFLPALMSDKIEIYSSAEDFILGLNIAMLLRIIIMLIFIFNKDKILENKSGALYFNIYFLSLFIYLALGAIPQIALRGGIYFYYFEFVLASMLIYRMKGFFRYVWLFFFISLSIWRQVSFFIEWTDDYVPYSNILFN